MVWTLLARKALLALSVASVIQYLLDGGDLGELRSNSPLAFGDIGVLPPVSGRSSALDCFARFLGSNLIGHNIADQASAKVAEALMSVHSRNSQTQFNAEMFNAGTEDAASMCV